MGNSCTFQKGGCYRYRSNYRVITQITQTKLVFSCNLSQKSTFSGWVTNKVGRIQFKKRCETLHIHKMWYSELRARSIYNVAHTKCYSDCRQNMMYNIAHTKHNMMCVLCNALVTKPPIFLLLCMYIPFVTNELHRRHITCAMRAGVPHATYVWHMGRHWYIVYVNEVTGVLPQTRITAVAATLCQLDGIFRYFP